MLETNSALASLVSDLRGEAGDLRACFREFVFKGTAFSAAAIGIIWRLSADDALVALSLVAIILFLITVQRIGIHKFSSANRHYGYQLHLERLRSTLEEPDLCSSARRKLLDIQCIGWEEALRAWRIVQATLFASLYRTPRHGRFGRLRSAEGWVDLDPLFYRYHPSIRWKLRTGRFDKHELPWFIQQTRAEQQDGEYHAGSYLQRSFGVLFLMQVLAWFLLAYEYFHCILASSGRVRVIVLGIVSVLSGAVVVLNQMGVRRRRLMLEDELLSIHSCAITWKAVTLAHLWAWPRRTKGGNYTEYRSYTEQLAFIAHRMANRPLRLLWGVERHDAEVFLEEEFDPVKSQQSCEPPPTKAARRSPQAPAP